MNGLKRLTTIRNISVQKGKNWVHKDIFRLLNKEDLWFVAYKNICIRNKLKNDYLDALTIEKLGEIRANVINGSYYPGSSKKYQKINLVNEKSFVDPDSIVLEVLRMILESICEPLFCEPNFGYSHDKNAHLALQYVENNFGDCTFVIQAELKQVYDSINHKVLMKLMQNYIEDSRFNHLIKKVINSGILNHEKKEVFLLLKNYEKTRIQELFISIYFQKFDEWIKTNITFNKSSASELTNANNTSLLYVRYKEHLIVGIRKDTNFAAYVQKEIENFLVKELKLSSPKTQVICLNAGHISFLDYEIYFTRKQQISKKTKIDSNYTNKLRFDVPINKVLKNLEENKLVKSTVSGYKPISKGNYTKLDDTRIVLYFTNIWDTLQTYYSGVTNRQKLQYIHWLLKMSCAMTLAHKHNSTCTEIFKTRVKTIRLESSSKKRNIFFEPRKMKTRKWKTSKIVRDPFNAFKS